MKKLCNFLLIIPMFTFAQYDYGFLKEHFFGRLPSARAEALGRSYAAIDGDLSTAYFNPAGTASIKGIEANASFATPYYLLKTAKYNFFSLGYKIKDYLIVGLSRNHFNYGDKIILTDVNGNQLGSHDSQHQTNYRLTLSSQPVKNLFIGVNTNYLIWQSWINKNTALYFDFGVIKKFQFKTKRNISQSLNIGASIVNLNYGKITSEFNGSLSKDNLPVITRFGANYQLSLDKHLLIDTLQTLRALFQVEYQDVLNCEFETALRGGAEIILLELVALRVGYYKETAYNYGYSYANNERVGGLTYGVGLQIPLYKLTKIPLNINLDYTSLPQVAYSTFYSNMPNFHSFSVKLNWIFKDKSIFEK